MNINFFENISNIQENVINNDKPLEKTPSITPQIPIVFKLNQADLLLGKQKLKPLQN